MVKSPQHIGLLKQRSPCCLHIVERHTLVLLVYRVESYHVRWRLVFGRVTHIVLTRLLVHLLSQHLVGVVGENLQRPLSYRHVIEPIVLRAQGGDNSSCLLYGYTVDRCELIGHPIGSYVPLLRRLDEVVGQGIVSSQDVLHHHYVEVRQDILGHLLDALLKDRLLGSVSLVVLQLPVRIDASVEKRQGLLVFVRQPDDNLLTLLCVLEGASSQLQREVDGW